MRKSNFQSIATLPLPPPESRRRRSDLSNPPENDVTCDSAKAAPFDRFCSPPPTHASAPFLFTSTGNSKAMLPQTLVALMAPLLALAQGDDGSLSGATTSAAAAGYSCDPSKCKLPKCNCASTSPPGGLSPSEVPMFVIFTADDAIQSYTLDSVNQFLAQRKNPNGCPIKMTYFTSLSNTNYSLVTDWFVAGNEIADHTMTHVGDPPQDEINGNLAALNTLAGIPYASIQGFRAPFLNYSVDMLKRLVSAEFTYDSSATSSIPVTDPGTDAYWPYTLDNLSSHTAA
ncbi:hypothetical protein MSAN_01187600 [Mycena sanguinolenta]|uniref:Chitin deacetylase n=1 Tax=Mycena sanguinolenta TaxID=230812 RepID=A0A8H7D4V7_9AGAR|nr:hypothetical protein MSAN_01187600 [Mycena sanguinolenta]